MSTDSVGGTTDDAVGYKERFNVKTTHKHTYVYVSYMCANEAVVYGYDN